ncbi:MAG: heparinase [Gammaproteobacteria bacterium]|nr:MAG: heparinase [Gammaproteobacteria bacterium]
MSSIASKATKLSAKAKSLASRSSLYLWTFRYLRPMQIAYMVVRRVINISPRLCEHIDPQTKTGFRLQNSICPENNLLQGSTLTFLNTTIEFDQNDIDWGCEEYPKLWRYNLHYFDYLLDPDTHVDKDRILIDSWIENNPPGMEDAWEPYTQSLRIVNWIKYFATVYPNEVPQRWLYSLYQQAYYLEQQIEYHILANHYLKNGIALLFAGTFFLGDDANRWRQKGMKIILEEAEEQLLDDGGHYERSPMYHSIVTEDYLDVFNLLESNDSFNSKQDKLYIQDKCRKALDYLAMVLLPDGDIPLFNDSAFKIAPPPESLFVYGSRLIDYQLPQTAESQQIINLPNSGYYGVKNGHDMIIADFGEIAPDYQPGHGHCDLLSYELALNGKRIIVDSGVYDYQANAERKYCRSTKGHNTIMLNNQEQSEIWGVFRVARRAMPISPSILENNASVVFSGGHSGYERQQRGRIHNRSIEINDFSWIITDRIEGSGSCLIENFIHLHPDISAAIEANKITLCNADGQMCAEIIYNGQVEASIEKSEWYPEFGKRIKNSMIVFSSQTQLPFEMEYVIKKV